MARLLIDAGADLERATEEGYTALTAAARQGHMEVVRLLLAANAGGRDQEGRTALVAATEGRQKAVVRELLAMKAVDVDARTDAGATALQHAAIKGFDDIAALLLKAGADVEAPQECGCTAIMIAAKAGKEEFVTPEAVTWEAAGGLSPSG
mmetsp:Transcript_42109/g.134590  ORF Transcript_42109/g.134590 Transcript_42109/m.134590 type:complete len:151 (-) Transcript_42109:1259-1711(-)